MLVRSPHIAPSTSRAGRCVATIKATRVVICFAISELQRRANAVLVFARSKSQRQGHTFSSAGLNTSIHSPDGRETSRLKIGSTEFLRKTKGSVAEAFVVVPERHQSGCSRPKYWSREPNTCHARSASAAAGLVRLMLAEWLSTTCVRSTKRNSGTHRARRIQR